MFIRLLTLGSILVLSVVAAPAGHSLQLSKVIIDNSGGEVKGKLKVGTMCLFRGPIKLRDRKITQDHERFQNLFARIMKERGYAVVATDADLFAGADQLPKGDYLFGATVHLEQIDLCSSLK